MKKKRILINAFMSVLQIIVVSIVLFILYKFLLRTLGIEQLGIWSIVLATTAATQIAQFGLTGSVVKFVAKYVARSDYEKVSLVIQTATISTGFFVGIVLLIFYPIAKWILVLIIPSEFLQYSINILPHAFLALWLLVITGIVQAGLDGYQRIDVRSFLLIGGSILHLLLCFVFAPTFKLIGVAYARVIQNLIVLVFSWLLLRKYLQILPLLPHRWSKGVFKEIIGYGINFQIISVSSMFYDPITKVLLSKFGGLSMVGYYEMASKMIQQFRSLLVSANQVLVPAIADLNEKIPNKIQSVYLTSYNLMFYLALPLYAFLIISMPVISILWIGSSENYFIVFGILLSIGWLLNTLNAPAYFAYLGLGTLKWNVIAHITIAMLNIVLGIICGYLFDGFGVVFAWIFSLALGSSIIYISYHLKNKMPLHLILPKASWLMVLISFICIFINYFFNFRSSNNFGVQYNYLAISIFILVTCILMWLHPIRKSLVMWINEGLIKKIQN